MSKASLCKIRPKLRESSFYLSLRLTVFASVLTLTPASATHVLTEKMAEECTMNHDSFARILAGVAWLQKEVSEDRWLAVCQALRQIGIEQPAEALIKAPSILLIPQKIDFAGRIQALTEMGFADSAGMVKTNPDLLGRNLEENLIPKIRALKEIGFTNPVKLIEGNPNITRLKAESIEHKLAELRGLGFRNPIHLAELSPTILGHDVDVNFKPKIERLRNLGFANPIAIIEGAPSLLSRRVDIFDEKISILGQLGFQDPVKMITGHPALLARRLPDAVSEKIQTLTNLGFIDARRLIEKYPYIVSLSTEATVSKVNDLRKVGFENPVEMFEKNPRLFSPSTASILVKLEQLRKLGYQNPVRLAENFSSILGYSIEDNVAPTTYFLKNAWGLSLAHIESTPVYLGASLNRMQAVIDLLKEYSVNPKALPAMVRNTCIRTLAARDIQANLVALGATNRDAAALLLKNPENFKAIFTKSSAASCETVLEPSVRADGSSN